MNGSSFSVCVHILTLLAHHPDDYLSSDFIAGSINMNPAMVRKEMVKLKKARLVESKEGKSGGNRIATTPAQITLKDVLLATRTGNEHILSMYKNHPNDRCPVGARIQDNLEELYTDIDKQVLTRLETISMEAFSQQFC